jgi:hypothetical protein
MKDRKYKTGPVLRRVPSEGVGRIKEGECGTYALHTCMKIKQ